MEIVIKSNWSEARRQDEINNYIQILGIHLFKQCQANKNLKAQTREKININLCTAYIKKLVDQYIHTIAYGSFSVELSAISVYEIAKIANELESESNLAL